MKNELERITKNREVKPGFDQAYFLNERFEILLSEIKKDTVLDPHSHDHVQFGYCFNNDFIFNINNENYPMNGGMSVILPSGMSHGAQATSNYQFLDFKFIDPKYILEDVAFKVFQPVSQSPELIVNEVWLGKSKILQLESKSKRASFKLALDKQYRYYLVSGKNTPVKIDGKEYSIEKMQIFLLNRQGTVEIQLPDENQLIFVIQAHESMYPGTAL